MLSIPEPKEDPLLFEEWTSFLTFDIERLVLLGKVTGGQEITEESLGNSIKQTLLHLAIFPFSKFKT